MLLQSQQCMYNSKYSRLHRLFNGTFCLLAFLTEAVVPLCIGDSASQDFPFSPSLQQTVGANSTLLSAAANMQPQTCSLSVLFLLASSSSSPPAQPLCTSTTRDGEIAAAVWTVHVQLCVTAHHVAGQSCAIAWGYTIFLFKSILKAQHSIST